MFTTAWRRASALILIGLLTSACTRSDSTIQDASAFRGVVIEPPFQRPDFTLTDFNGDPYNFRERTEGKVALLFFGYTHCPDVCPLHAANIAAVLKQMPFEEREKIQFIFITTDPQRDTPQRLKSWLGAFDSSYIGLSGPAAEVSRIGASLGIAPAKKEIPANGDSANYLIGHGAQVVAFGLDGQGRLEYPFGVRQEDWAVDLPRLARGEVPRVDQVAAQEGPAAIDLAPTTAATPAGPSLQVLAALMPAPASQSEAAVYLIIRNDGTTPDTLTGVSSPDAEAAMLHGTVRDGSTMRMTMLSSIPIPAGGTLELRPGGTHVMLARLKRMPAIGDSWPLRLSFARGGEISLAPVVIAYADLEAQLQAAAR